jgi:hypothetical protein
MNDKHAESRDRKRAKARKMAVSGRTVFTMDQAERKRATLGKDWRKRAVITPEDVALPRSLWWRGVCLNTYAEAVRRGLAKE